MNLWTYEPRGNVNVMNTLNYFINYYCCNKNYRRMKPKVGGFFHASPELLSKYPRYLGKVPYFRIKYNTNYLLIPYPFPTSHFPSLYTLLYTLLSTLLYSTHPLRNCCSFLSKHYTSALHPDWLLALPTLPSPGPLKRSQTSSSTLASQTSLPTHGLSVLTVREGEQPSSLRIEQTKLFRSVLLVPFESLAAQELLHSHSLHSRSQPQHQFESFNNPY